MARSPKAAASHPPKPTASARQPCTGQNATRSIALPVIAEPGKPPPLRASKAGRWRALVLIGVHLLFLVHLLHWRAAGSTLTPVEPSEAMETFRDGAVNAGFIFFGLTIAATLILGRFFCGWGCHIVALQDLSLWILKKLKLRPKAFRSRLLMFVPLIAAIYMFVIPLVDRLYAQHVVGTHVPPFSLHLTRAGFWDTFPGPVVAVLTFLFCGVFMVYLIGPKAFCTYACPYGAAFGLSDKIAPGRIRVTDACEGCGHCTATCTSNVNVAEEVRLYGMVVDPGCMKCMDCISVCPNDALYFGFAKPVLRPQPSEPAKPRRWDLTWPEEIAAAVIFLAFFLTYRGIYGGAIPFLFALGVAGIGTFVAMQAIHLFRRDTVSIQRIRLKSAGRFTSMGVAFLVAFAGLIALTVHSATWQVHRYLADRAFNAAPGDAPGWQFDPSFFNNFNVAQREAASAGLAHVDWCHKWGLLPARDLHTQAAWLALTAGKPDRAAEHVREAIRLSDQNAEMWLHLATVETFRGNDAGAHAAFGEAIKIETREREEQQRKLFTTSRPASGRVWLEWGTYLSRKGRNDEAAEALARATEYAPAFAPVWVGLGDFQLRTGRVDDARRSLIRALTLESHDANAALGLMIVGRNDHQDFRAAIDEYKVAIKDHPTVLAFHANLGYALAAIGDGSTSVAAYREALRLNPNAPELRAELGAVLMTIGDLPGAIREYEAVNGLLPDNPEAAFKLAFLYEQANRPGDALTWYRAAARGNVPQLRAAAEDAIQRLTPSRRP